MVPTPLSPAPSYAQGSGTPPQDNIRSPPLQQSYPDPKPVQQPVQPPPQQPFIQQRQTYAASVPMQALNQGPAPVDCPLCGVRALTNISFESGSSTQ
jgi:lipopolysaccharide-induced tumor necrosis factor-alpha factor